MLKLRTLLLFLLVSVLWFSIVLPSEPSPNVPYGCREKCGNISIFYPFGLDEPRCAININNTKRNRFLLECNSSTSPPRLFFGGNVPIVNISVDEGLISAKLGAAQDCYNHTTKTETSISLSMKMPTNFRFSKHNKLTVFGCDTFGYISDRKINITTGCLSVCSENVEFSKNDSCSGFGCCQASVPESFRRLKSFLSSTSNYSDVYDINPCGIAFLSDQRSFKFVDFQLSDGYPDEYMNAESVIEWFVEGKTCDEVKYSRSYACRNNTDCFSNNGKGYRCLCKPGFSGNPYLHGCQDIDECKDPIKYQCHGHCKNTIGNYTCKCSFGRSGDGKVSCQLLGFITVASVIAPVVLFGIISVLIAMMLRKRRKQKNFLKNGGKLLENQRVKIYSDEELATATNKYDKTNLIGEGGFGSVYKGKLRDGTQVAIKKPKDLKKTQINEDFRNEIGIISQINHKNVVKILGICLETKIPLLVYELISNGSLDHYLHHQTSIRVVKNWGNCLRIASEAARAFEYLHSLANPPVIHGDVKPANILLDEHYTAKVADFGASVIISPDQNIMDSKIQGTLGYIDPEYFLTGILTEKSDVYSFGIVLVEIITGEKPNSVARWGGKTTIQYFRSALEGNRLNEMLCFIVNSDDEMEQIQIFANVAKNCLNSIGDKRPTMTEVAEELGKLKHQHMDKESDHQIAMQEMSRVQYEDEETENSEPVYTISGPTTR
ncbi:Wall-associated kinase family protein [Euphorbia peplus]|nr:Wall-associated kinase family protein [Euphorbia peplus]